MKGSKKQTVVIVKRSIFILGDAKRASCTFLDERVSQPSSLVPLCPLSTPPSVFTEIDIQYSPLEVVLVLVVIIAEVVQCLYKQL